VRWIRWDSSRTAPRCVGRSEDQGSDLTANSSIKTVGIHVSHIPHKLDIPTRVEAAAIAHRNASD